MVEAAATPVLLQKQADATVTLHQPKSVSFDAIVTPPVCNKETGVFKTGKNDLLRSCDTVSIP